MWNFKCQLLIKKKINPVHSRSPLPFLTKHNWQACLSSCVPSNGFLPASAEDTGILAAELLKTFEKSFLVWPAIPM